MFSAGFAINKVIQLLESLSESELDENDSPKFF